MFFGKLKDTLWKEEKQKNTLHKVKDCETIETETIKISPKYPLFLLYLALVLLISLMMNLSKVFMNIIVAATFVVQLMITILVLKNKFTLSNT